MHSMPRAKGPAASGEFGDRLARASAGPGSPAETEAAAALRSLVTEAMNDDLNAPRAVAALFDFVREGNRLLDGSKSAGPELRAVWAWAAQVLDVAATPSATHSITSADTVTMTDSVTAADRRFRRMGSRNGDRARAGSERPVTSSGQMRYEMN